MYNNGKETGNFEKERIATEILDFANKSAKLANDDNAKNNVSSTNKVSHIKIENQINNSNDSNKLNKLKNNIEKKPSNISSIIASIISDGSNSSHNNSQKTNNTKFNNLIMKINASMKRDSSKNKSIKNINSKNSKIKSIKSESIKNKTIKSEAIKSLIEAVIPCKSIRYAKICKTNPKCMYDGRNLRCKDKPITNIFKKQTQTRLFTKSKTQNIRKSKSKSKSKSNSKSNSKINSKNIRKEYDLSKTTKSLFDQLIKSFGKISNEASKDSKLLKSATNKL